MSKPGSIFQNYSVCPECNYVSHKGGLSKYVYKVSENECCPHCGSERIPGAHGNTILRPIYSLSGIKWQCPDGSYFDDSDPRKKEEPQKSLESRIEELKKDIDATHKRISVAEDKLFLGQDREILEGIIRDKEQAREAVKEDMAESIAENLIDDWETAIKARYCVSIKAGCVGRKCLSWEKSLTWLNEHMTVKLWCLHGNFPEKEETIEGKNGL